MSGAILGVETSCDDSCAAVLSADGVILSNVISSQAIHDKYGGVVPEIAARHHLELLTPAIASALAQAGLGLEQIERVAVTQGPGLIGALLVGVGQAKAIAAARAIPLVAVDHLQGHVAANFIAPDPFEPPFICLIASGGHTLLARVEDHSSYTLLGETLDDAARVAAFQSIDATIAADVPVTPIAYFNRTVVCSARLHEAVLSPMDLFDFTGVWIE